MGGNVSDIGITETTNKLNLFIVIVVPAYFFEVVLAKR